MPGRGGRFFPVGRCVPLLSFPLLSFLVLSFLAGCGFRPLLADRDGSASEARAVLSRIEVDPIADRVGQIVRNALVDRLRPRGRSPGPSRHRLEVVLSEGESRAGFEDENKATFTVYVLDARYRVVDIATGRPIASGRVSSSSSFNLVRSDFVAQIGRQSARRNAAGDIAALLAGRLAAVLRRGNAGDGPEAG